MDQGRKNNPESGVESQESTVGKQSRVQEKTRKAVMSNK